MTEEMPTAKEWRCLYDAALAFRDAEPWKWVLEKDLFGVLNRRNGETGYCCVMGELGEFPGMVIYRGTVGLEGYRRIMKGQVKPGEGGSLFVQDCLVVSFEDREHTDVEDRKVVRSLGLKIRGKKAWPAFRSHEPGSYPWFVTGTEALFMTDALEQALDVCLRLKNDPLLLPKGRGAYLVRVPDEKAGGKAWRDEVRRPLPLRKTSSPVIVDELRLQRIKKSAAPSDAVWEIDAAYAPMPVREGGRPYFPLVVLIVDHESGYVFDVYLARRDEVGHAVIERVLSCLETVQILPAEIRVRSDEIQRQLDPCASRLRFALTKGRRLTMVDHARKELDKMVFRKNATAGRGRA